MFIQLKKTYFGKQPGERVDVDEANAKCLIEQGIAEAVQGDHLGALIEKQIGGMLEGLTRGLNETITKTLEQFAKTQTLSRKSAVPAIFGESGEGEPKKNFGDWLLNVAIAGSKNGKVGQRSPGPARKRVRVHVQRLAEGGPGESSGVTGGYIVAPDFYNALLSLW